MTEGLAFIHDVAGVALGVLIGYLIIEWAVRKR